MFTTTSKPVRYDRGDVLLVNYASKDEQGLHHRPVMVISHDSPGAEHVFVVPISPDPMENTPALLVTEGSFEAARMGLLTNGYLNACEVIEVPLAAVTRRVGQCPWRLLQEFQALHRRPNIDRVGSGGEMYLPVLRRTRPN
jgi:mRNA-degrading endonuclease toxin of MazEF toxin-antitoxin module